MQNQISNEEVANDFQLREILDNYLSYWRWFLLGIFVCLTVAYTYLRYAVPQYSAATTILIKDEKKGGMLSELSAFSDMGLGRGGNNVENEIEILKSRTLVESTIKRLNYNISVFVEGKFRTTEIYKNKPVTVRFSNTTNEFENASENFKIIAKSATTFSLKASNANENEIPGFILNKKSLYKYSELIATSLGDLKIEKSASNFGEFTKSKQEFLIKISPVEGLAQSYRGRLLINPVSKSSNILELSITDPLVEKAEDFLDELVSIYNENAIKDKNAISENTSKFINHRLVLITEELGGVEQNAERFKTANKLTDIQTEAEQFITGSGEYNKKNIDLEIQLNLVNSVMGFMKKSSKFDLLPSNLNMGESGASGLINSYNELILNRNRLLKSASSDNPSIVKLDQQINALHANVISSLEQLKSNLNIQKRNLKAQEGLLDSKIGKIPNQERLYRVIERQQKVKEGLYLYLLQKKEETAITLSTTEPNARVVDAAKGGGPVSPKRKNIYLFAFLAGVLIPFGIIYLMNLLDTKIKSRLDLEKRTQIPFIGDVPTSEDASTIMQAESRSSSAEALRIIRTNLEFMVSRVPEGIAKTIFLTSTFPKEGKTFVSVNLAATFALSGKKVLLVGMDIRNPRLDDYLTLPDRGFTNYLSSKDLNLDDLIIKQKGYEDFHILPAGAIPPNPAELLMSKKVDSFFETIKKQYDYIIVDTAPVSLVTDTLLIAKHADTFIYVARANFLEKRMLDIPNGLYKDQKLPNMCILLNDTDSTKGYGYGYGYGVKVEHKPWYKKIFNS